MSPAGGIVALRAWNEAKMRRGHGPDAAKTDLDTGQAFGLIPEDRSIVGLAIMIVILEEGDSVIEARIESIDSKDEWKEVLRGHRID